MKSQSKGLLITAAVVIVIGAGFMMMRQARAASEDSWEAFRRDVEAQCLETARGDSGLFAAGASATVDPFGSQSYGLALVEGPARGAEDVRIAAICVYDKQAKTVEMGGELPRE